MKYQFQVDGRGFGAPIRNTWDDAARDAVSAGYGHFVGDGAVRLNDQAAIARIPEETDGDAT